MKLTRAEIAKHAEIFGKGLEIHRIRNLRDIRMFQNTFLTIPASTERRFMRGSYWYQEKAYEMKYHISREDNAPAIFEFWALGTDKLRDAVDQIASLTVLSCEEIPEYDRVIEYASDSDGNFYQKVILEPSSIDSLKMELSLLAKLT